MGYEGEGFFPEMQEQKKRRASTYWSKELRRLNAEVKRKEKLDRLEAMAQVFCLGPDDAE